MEWNFKRGKMRCHLNTGKVLQSDEKNLCDTSIQTTKSQQTTCRIVHQGKQESPHH